MESSGPTAGTRPPTKPGSDPCLSEKSTPVEDCWVAGLDYTRYRDNTAADWRTKKAAEGQLPAAQSVHQPHAQQGKHKVAAGGGSSQPDGLFIIPDSRHLQNGGAVVPGERGPGQELRGGVRVTPGWQHRRGHEHMCDIHDCVYAAQLLEHLQAAADDQRPASRTVTEDPQNNQPL